MVDRLIGLARYAWVVLAYNLAVIVFGAYVRASGSGAGCGSHWPMCNGVVVPVSPSLETIVEYTHRTSSGLALLAVAVLLFWTLRVAPKGHAARLGAWLSSFFILTEALVGAGLVLFGWVADDTSVGRAVSITIHLVNTFLLLGSLALTAWWASGGQPVSLKGRGPVLWAIGLGLLLVLLIGVSGAITALGDTLFPPNSLGEGLQRDFASDAHFLERLRVWHPLIAIATGFYLLFLAGLLGLFSDHPAVKRLAAVLGGLFMVQLLAGLVNLVLLAPVAMQLVHLLLADLVWISLVLFSAAVFRTEPLEASEAYQASAAGPA